MVENKALCVIELARLSVSLDVAQFASPAPREPQE
jgi:hypothetical protein